MTGSVKEVWAREMEALYRIDFVVWFFVPNVMIHWLMSPHSGS